MTGRDQHDEDVGAEEQQDDHEQQERDRGVDGHVHDERSRLAPRKRGGRLGRLLRRGRLAHAVGVKSMTVTGPVRSGLTRFCIAFGSVSTPIASARSAPTVQVSRGSTENGS